MCYRTEILKEDVLPALGLAIEEAAEQLGVPNEYFNAIINNKIPITLEFAQKIEKWLGVENGGRAELWVSD